MPVPERRYLRLIAQVLVLSFFLAASVESPVFAKYKPVLIDTKRILEPSFWSRMYSISENGKFGLATFSPSICTKPDRWYLINLQTKRILGSFESRHLGFWSPNQRYVALLGYRVAPVLFDILKERIGDLPTEFNSPEISIPVWTRDSLELAAVVDKQLLVFSLKENRIVLRVDLERTCTPSGWSPDGRFITCYIRDLKPKYWRGNPIIEAFVVDRQSGKECLRVKLPVDRDSESGWSPDSSKFICLDNQFNLTVFNRDGWQQVVELSDEQKKLMPFWVDGLDSPDKKLSAITRDGKVQILDKASGKIVVSKTGFFKSFPFRFLQWSADSKRIYIAWHSYNGFIDASSGNFHELADHRSVRFYMPLTDSVIRKPTEPYLYPQDPSLKIPMPPQIIFNHAIVKQYNEPSSVAECMELLDKSLDASTVEKFKKLDYSRVSHYGGPGIIFDSVFLELFSFWDMRKLASQLETAGVEIEDEDTFELYIISEYWKHLHPELKDAYPWGKRKQ